MNLTKVEIRIILIYLMINALALITNYFKVPIKYVPTYTSPYYMSEYYLFTDAITGSRKGEGIYGWTAGGTDNFCIDSDKHFWPLTSFYYANTEGVVGGKRFRGIFPDYDFSEFALYLGIFVVFLGFKKYWKGRS